MGMNMGLGQRPVQISRLKCNYCNGYLNEHEAKCQLKEMEWLQNVKAEEVVICPKCRSLAYPNGSDYLECSKCNTQYSTNASQEDVGERVFLESVRNMNERSRWGTVLPDKGSGNFPYDNRIKEVQIRMQDNPHYKKWKRKQMKSSKSPKSRR